MRRRRRETRRLAKRRELGARRVAEGARRQLPQLDRAEGDALELVDAMSDRLAETADDVPLPAPYPNLEPGLRRQLVEDAHAGRDRGTRTETDAAT